MRRFRLLYVAPTLLVLLGAIWPLVSGRETLYLRDVLTSHYPLKAAQAEALRRGTLPLVDVYRAGGQPMLGNPNVLPLYPDNALFAVASPLWALNAHFWIHLLIAPAAFYWLARAWRLSRPAAWAAGVFYASSGFMLSLLNLYNLIAAAALAPAFVAASLDAWRGACRRWVWPALGGLWALLILAGDPLFALLALLAAIAAGAVRFRSWPRRPVRFAAALACGGALAAPMVVELLRILPLSLRGYRSYSPESALLQSWDPRGAVEWLLPLVFGPPDLSFWGQRFFDGLPPLFYSLYPGLLCLALIPLAGPRAGRAAAWGWAMVAVGLFLALGKWNPSMRYLYELPGASALRYPVKTWLLVALGASLLCGLGFQRVVAGGARRRLGRHLAVLGLLVATAWTLLNSPLGDRLRVLDPQRLAGAAFTHQRLRWGGLCLLSLAVLAALAIALYAMRRHPLRGGALLVTLHLAAQLFFLRPLFDSDVVGPYVEPPEMLAEIPAGARLVHGGFKDLFGPQTLDAGSLPFPDASTRWLTRSHFAQLYPFAGIPWGARYELNPSPEGLDSFLTFALTQALPRMTDTQRLQVLAASGVDVLLLDRRLDAATRSRVELLARRVIPGGELFVYRQPAAAPAQLVTRIHHAPHMNAALRLLTAPTFDSRTETVLPARDGEAEASSSSAGGRATIVSESADEILVEIDARSPGILVVQRTYLEIYRVTIDGEPAVLEPANLHRLGVVVPAGRHTVRVWADRRPTRLAGWTAALGLVGLAFVAGVHGRARR